jgi:RNA recognition motif-containing protein
VADVAGTAVEAASATDPVFGLVFIQGRAFALLFFFRKDSVSMKLYVGNLLYNTTEDDLRTLFTQYGTVDSVAVITDRDTGQSKGFGFVEFGDDTEAKNAISALSGQQYGGRALTVNEARPKTTGGGGRGGFGGGGRDRY